MKVRAYVKVRGKDEYKPNPRLARLKEKRPTVVEAYMTTSTTPFITERLANGKTRLTGRHQVFQAVVNGQLRELTLAERSERELAQIIETYGDRWTGIHSPPTADFQQGA
jgi:hypothetical protein